jgi:signal transduction histidine kinase
MAAEVVTAMGRAQRLVDSLLLLARSEQPPTTAETEDLADLAHDALDLSRQALRQRGIRMHTGLARAPVRGDVSLLSRAVANLVENAVRHNRDGGQIEIASGTDADVSWVRVTNTGPDMSTTDLTKLFEPFNRGERTRLNHGGAGLGLSIVAAVARSHGGTVSATARPAADGGGLSVLLRLPRNL